MIESPRGGAARRIDPTVPLAVVGVVAAVALPTAAYFEWPWPAWAAIATWLLLSLVAALMIGDPSCRAYIEGTLRHKRFTQVYRAVVARPLSKLWGRYCNPVGAYSGVYDNFRQALAWPLFDAAMILAVLYPFLLFMSSWVFGYEGRLGSVVILSSTAFFPSRAITLFIIAAFILSTIAARLIPWIPSVVLRLVYLFIAVTLVIGIIQIEIAFVLVYFSVAFGTFTLRIGGRGLGALLISYLYVMAAIMASEQGQIDGFVGAFFGFQLGAVFFELIRFALPAICFAAGASVSPILVWLVAQLSVLVCSVMGSIILSGSYISAVPILTFHLYIVFILGSDLLGHGRLTKPTSRHPDHLSAMTKTVALASIPLSWFTFIGIFPDSLLSIEVSLIFVFVGVFPIVNALFDWISFAVTLALMKSGLQWNLPVLAGAIDLCIACILFLALGATLTCLITTMNVWADRTVVDLEGLFAGIHDKPHEYWWLYGMLFFTILPTGIHGFASLLGVQGSMPLRLRRPIANLVRDSEHSPANAAFAPLLVGLIWIVPLIVIAVVWWSFWLLAFPQIAWLGNSYLKVLTEIALRVGAF